MIIVVAATIIAFRSSEKVSLLESQKSANNKNVNSNISIKNSNSINTDNFDLSGNTPDNINTNTQIIGQSPTDSTEPLYYADQATKESAASDYNTAIVNINKAISLQNTNPNFYISKAEILVKMNQKDEGISVIRQALTILPDNNLLTSELDILTSN